MSIKNFEIEFEAICELEGNSKNYVRIPDVILLDCRVDKIRVALCSYLYMCKGMNNIVNFSIPLFLNWAGFKNDTHAGGLNDKVLKTLYFLADIGYVHFMCSKELTRTSCVEIMVDADWMTSVCNSGERFAMVYLDELESITKYRNENKKDTHLNFFSVLLVFAYLRRSIPRRQNTLKPEERSEERMVDRRQRLPEAYNGQYKDIADELGLSERVVSKSIEILRKLKLIVLGTPYRVKNIDGEFRTPDFIFSNYQKRDNGQLLACGMEYAKTEISIKAKQMHDYHKRYGINYNLKEVS